MPMLMYAIDQIHRFKLQNPSWNFRYRDPIKSFYDTVSMSNKLAGERLEENFINIMNNWKEFKRKIEQNM